MLAFAFVALLNGGLITTSRAINARLGVAIGVLHSSFWNHIVGFFFLGAILIVTGETGFGGILEAPRFTYFGGILGALFVAINSYVLPRIGAVATLVLIICGQMITGLAIDYLTRDRLPTLTQIAAIALIVTGVAIARSAALQSKE